MIRGKAVTQPGWPSMLAATAALLPHPARGSMAFHELGHYAASWLLRAPVVKVRLDGPADDDTHVSAYVSIQGVGGLREMVIALAGPVFSWIHVAGIVVAAIALSGGGGDFRAAWRAWQER